MSAVGSTFPSMSSTSTSFLVKSFIAENAAAEVPMI